MIVVPRHSEFKRFEFVAVLLLISLFFRQCDFCCCVVFACFTAEQIRTHLCWINQLCFSLQDFHCNTQSIFWLHFVTDRIWWPAFTDEQVSVNSCGEQAVSLSTRLVDLFCTRCSLWLLPAGCLVHSGRVVGIEAKRHPCEICTRSPSFFGSVHCEIQGLHQFWKHIWECAHFLTFEKSCVSDWQAEINVAKTAVILQCLFSEPQLFCSLSARAISTQVLASVEAQKNYSFCVTNQGERRIVFL